MADHDGAIPSDLWRVLYGIQGEAQQAAEGDRACETPEKCWERIEKVLPPEISKAVNMHEVFKNILSRCLDHVPLSLWDEINSLLAEAEQQP